MHDGRHAPLRGRAAIAPRQLSGRGVSYWTDGKGDERILYVTTGYRLVARNAKNGSMIQSFGDGGVVDLKKAVVFGKSQQIDLDTGEIGLHATPTVVKGGNYPGEYLAFALPGASTRTY